VEVLPFPISVHCNALDTEKPHTANLEK